MKRPSIIACCIVALFGGWRLAGAPLIGIGMEWGIAYEQFQDSRMTGQGQIINLNFFVNDSFQLFVLLEEQSVALDDDDVSVDFKVTYNGVGLSYETAWARAGLAFGKADIRYPFLWFVPEESAMFVELFGAVHLVKEDGKKLSYFVTAALKYRFLRLESLTMANFPIYSDAVNGNGAVVSLTIGLGF